MNSIRCGRSPYRLRRLMVVPASGLRTFMCRSKQTAAGTERNAVLAVIIFALVMRGFLSVSPPGSQPEKKCRSTSLQIMMKPIRERGLKSGGVYENREIILRKTIECSESLISRVRTRKHRVVTRYSCGCSIRPNLKWELPCNILHFRDRNLSWPEAVPSLPIAKTH
jgi:hypothetical protein